MKGTDTLSGLVEQAVRRYHTPAGRIKRTIRFVERARTGNYTLSTRMKAPIAWSEFSGQGFKMLHTAWQDEENKGMVRTCCGGHEKMSHTVWKNDRTKGLVKID